MTKKSKKTRSERGHIKGEHFRFIAGHALVLQNKRKPLEERYRVNRKTGCWEWVSTKQDGYGIICFGKKTIRAHRYMYEKYKGKITKNLMMDHLCRNTKCVNPDHLEPVTPKENTRRGVATKLSVRKAGKIRELWGSGKYLQKELAKMYNVTAPCISAITRNITWQ